MYRVNDETIRRSTEINKYKLKTIKLSDHASVTECAFKVKIAGISRNSILLCLKPQGIYSYEVFHGKLKFEKQYLNDDDTNDYMNKKQKQKTPWPVVRERTILTE
jgi:hypothetical protein